MAGFIILLLAAVYMGAKGKKEPLSQDVQTKQSGKWEWKGCFSILAVLFCCGAVTMYYGPKIYGSASGFNGKLSRFLYEISHKKTISLENDNLYRDGIDGFLEELDQKLNMPDELYLATSFNLHFLADGTIQTVETFLHGQDEDGAEKSYLISYDREQSDKMTVYLNGTVSGNQEEGKQFRPLVTVLNLVNLETAVSRWNAKEYGILYYGMRSWGNDSTGILYLNEKGEAAAARDGETDIGGYTVSLFIPGREEEITPIRYLLKDSSGIGKADAQEQAPETPLKNSDEEYYLNEKEGFRLKEVDAAGIAFINQNLGFMALSHNGGDEAELYRTEDGGKTIKKVGLPYSVMEESPNLEEPFDFPYMPYEEEGILKMLIGQGADGDYHGGSKVLYQSGIWE